MPLPRRTGQEPTSSLVRLPIGTYKRPPLGGPHGSSGKTPHREQSTTHAKGLPPVTENLGVPGSNGARMRREWKIHDFDAPVGVDPPPADQTVEVKDRKGIARATS